MLQGSQSLREKFDAKEQQIFEMHLQFNGSSRSLFEELLRKNNETIKLCINSFTEANARLDQYDATFQRFNEELVRMADMQSNFHLEFRCTHLEIQKKHKQLNNDVSFLKDALKIPNQQSSEEVYLNSQFKRQKSCKLMPRTKGRGLVRSKTNVFAHPCFNLNDGEEDLEFFQAKSIQNFKEEPSPLQNNEVFQEIIANKKPILKHAYTSMIEQGIEETFIKHQHLQNNQQFEAKLNKLQLKVQQHLRQIQNSKQKQVISNQIDLQEVYRKINQRISKQLSSKVQLIFFQSSLQNLKQAWQTEENQLYLQLQNKIDKKNFLELVQKISRIAENTQQLKKNFENEVKANRLNLNKTQIGLMSKQNLALSQIMVVDSMMRNQEQRNSMNNSIKYSNSYSIVKIGRKQGKYLGMDSLREFKQNSNLTQKAWKQRVNDLLGENKAIKRAKNCKK